MNVLGVLFDSKLSWSDHISLTISKTKKTICALRLISKYFTPKQLLQIVTSNVYSVLFYNSEIWHIPSLKSNLKQKLLSTSALALKMCLKNNDPMISFERLHQIAKRATPEKMMLYKHAILLYKMYNSENHSNEWVHLNLNQVITSRQTKFNILKTNQLKVGLNAPANRLHSINNYIPLTWLNYSFNTFKIKAKDLILN